MEIETLEGLEKCGQIADPLAGNPGLGGRIKSSGTGFLIDAEGRLLTANHVIEDRCRSASIVFREVEYPVAVVAADKEWDLAVLKADIQSFYFARFLESGAIRTGLEVAAFGFPLQGLLSPTPSLTTGLLSNAEFIKGSSDLLQNTAPIQPGNSGGPLIALSGGVVGLTVGTLNTSVRAMLRGEVMLQNMNFAVGGARIQQFLRQSQIRFETVSPGDELPTTVIADQARMYTVIVLCRE